MDETKIEELFTEGMLRIINERKPMYDYQKAFFRMQMWRMFSRARQLQGVKKETQMKTLPDVSHVLGRGKKSRYLSYDEFLSHPKFEVRKAPYLHHLPTGELVSKPKVEIKIVKDRN